MFAEPQRAGKSAFRHPTLYTLALILIAALYAGGTILWRWRENRAMALQAAEKEREADKRTLEMMGGERLAIQSFTATPGIVRPGERAQICYGVANAKTVKIEPAPEQAVWPSYTRCVDVKPTKDTTYRITAEDGKGNSMTETLTIRVQRGAGAPAA